MEKFYYNLQGGLNTELTPVLLGSGGKKLYWADSKNVEIYKNQGITRQKGNKVCLNLKNLFGNENSAQNPVPVAIYPYIKGTKNFVIGFNNGEIYYYDSFLDTLERVFSFGVCPLDYIFEYFLDGLVISPVEYRENAVDSIYFKLNKDKTLEECVYQMNFKDQNDAFMRPNAAAQYAGRIWLSVGNTLYYSALGTFDDWTSAHDAGYISKFHSSTLEITAICPYSGSLAIYKEFETFLLTGDNPENFEIAKFSDKGVCGRRAIVTCNNKQYFFNDCGLFSLSMSGELNQIVLGQNLALNILKMLEKIDLEALSRAFILPYEKKNQIWIFPPILNEDGQKQVWIYDYNNCCWFTRDIPYKITCAEAILGEIYTVTPDGGGKVFVENKGNTFSGKTIEFRFSTPFFNFSAPTSRKIIEDLRVVFGGNSDNNFIFRASKDNFSTNDTHSEAIEVEKGGSLYWGGDEVSQNAFAVWDSANGLTWADNLEESVKLDVFDAVKSVQLHFEGNLPVHDLTIIGIEFRDVYVDD